MKTIQAIFFLLLITSGILVAQDGHYWTQQYGTRSMLLSGSVIGGVEDLGAVYYNPARLPQIKNPAFLISADVYEMNRINVSDAFGNNLNTSSRDIKGVPSLAAGTFKVPFLPKHHFAWAVLVRSNSDLNFSYKNEVYGDVLENYPGKEYLGAELGVTQTTNEQWTGGSWSYPITDKFSVGVSGYLSLYTINKGLIINLQGYTESRQTAIYRYNRGVNLEQYSLLSKIGISYKEKHFILGLTFLTPRIYLDGSGGFQHEVFFSGVRGESVNDDEYTTSYQGGLKTQHKSPMAIGGGITFLVKKSRIHLSSEWFNAVPRYTLLEVSDYVSQSTGDTLSFRLVDQLNSVINFGLGVELYLNDKISGYLSACADHSAVISGRAGFTENKAEATNSVFVADYFHFGGGFVLHVKGADITLGATYTGGSQEFNRPFTFPEDETDDVFDPNDKALLKWDRVRLVFSFSVPFLKDVQKKLEEKIGL